MKKYLLTAGVLALATVSFFTSCKDDDEIEIDTTVKTSLNDKQLADKLEDAVKAEAAANDGTTTSSEGTVTTTTTTTTTSTVNPDGNVVTTTTSVATSVDTATGETSTTTEVVENEYSYTYEVNGVTYNTIEEVQAAVNQLPAGSTATVTATLHQTTTTQRFDKDGNLIDTKTTENSQKGDATTITIPDQEGKSSTSTIQVPASTTDATKTTQVDVTIQTTEKPLHSGGAAK